MNIKPIIFSTPMVEAILSGRKTQTRRVINPQPQRFFEVNEDKPGNLYLYDVEWGLGRIRPKYQVGDILWVRETFAKIDSRFGGDLEQGEYAYVYKASENGKTWEREIEDWKWKPSIHMPKEAARIFLKVTDVRCERLQDITEEQAIKEGSIPILCDGAVFISAKGVFLALWNSTIKKQDIDKYGWSANPWVWVYEFEVAEKNGEKGCGSV